MATKDAMGSIHPVVPGDSYAASADPGRGGRRYFMGLSVRSWTSNISENHLDKITLNLAVYGAGLVLVGLVAILFPLIFTLAIGKFMSWLLIFGGAMALVQFFLMCGAPGNSSFLLLGALHLLVAMLVLIHPVRRGNLVILVFSAWFLFHGVLKVLMSFQLRNFPTWPALMTGGFVSVVLAFIVLVLAPRFGLVMLSIVFGSDLLLSGMTMLVLACLTFLGKRRAGISGPSPGVESREPLMTGMSHAAASA